VSESKWLKSLPFPISFGIFKDQILVDLTSEEETIILSRGTVVLDDEGSIIFSEINLEECESTAFNLQRHFEDMLAARGHLLSKILNLGMVV